MPVVAARVYGGFRLDPLPESSLPSVELVNLAEGSYEAGTLLGERTATPGTFAPYASTNTDGSENPSAILKYSVTIDSDGHAVWDGGDWLVPQNAVAIPAYLSGVFKVADIVGLDQNAIDKLGRLIGTQRIMFHGVGKLSSIEDEE